MIEMTLAELGMLQQSYQPGADALRRLHDVTFVPVVGPFLVGKNTVMDAATRLDHDFGRVRSFTTRARRDDEPADLYDFLPHTETALRQLLTQVQQHKLVHFIVHPTTHNVYGSRLAAWHRPFMVLDTLPGAIKTLQALPFKTMRPVAITVPPDQWLQRLHGRSDGEEERNKRLREGIANIEWCLEQSVPWLVNSDCTPAQAATRLITIAKYGGPGDPNGPVVAAQLLATLRALLR